MSVGGGAEQRQGQQAAPARPAPAQGDHSGRGRAEQGVDQRKSGDGIGDILWRWDSDGIGELMEDSLVAK